MTYQMKYQMLWSAHTDKILQCSTGRGKIMSWQIVFQDIPYGALKAMTMDPGLLMTSGRGSRWKPMYVQHKPSTNMKAEY